MNKGIIKLIAVLAAVSVIAPGFTVASASESVVADNAIVTLAETPGSSETVVFEENFDNLDWSSMTMGNDPQTKLVGEHMQLYVGNRSGGDTSTGFVVESDQLKIMCGRFASSNRGPAISFVGLEDKVEKDSKLITRFQYKPTEVVESAFIRVCDPEGAKDEELVTIDVNENELHANEWNDVRIVTMSDGASEIYVNGKMVKTFEMPGYVYPTIRFVNDAKYSQALIDNLVLSYETISLDAVLDGLDIENEYVESINGKYLVKDNFDLPTAAGANISWSVMQKKIGEGEWEETKLLAVENNKLVITQTDELSNYEFQLVANVTFGGEEGTKSFNITLETPSEAIAKAKENLKLYDKATGDEIVAEGDIYNVSADLSLYKGEGKVSVSWSCEDVDGNKSSLISSEGVIMVSGTDDPVKLIAKISCGSVTDTKEFQIKLPNAVNEYINPAIETLKGKSADNSEVVYADLSNIGLVKNDIILDTTAECPDGKIRVEWISGSDSVVVKENGLIEVVVKDYSVTEASVIAKVIYSKNGVDLASKETEPYKFQIQFTENDLSGETAIANADKYKVRFDAALDDNYKNMPESTTSDLTLNEKGKFGSIINWKSSDPGVISNSGGVTRQSTDRTVTLTASVRSGDSIATREFKVKVEAKKTSSGGNGGGGSSSSTGSSGSGSGSGGIASNSNTSISTGNKGEDKVDELIQEKEEAENRFRDMGSVSWARDAINALADAGIVNGKSDTEFAPNDNVTRAEFAKMLMKTFGLESKSFTESSFADVSTDAWYFDCVETAYNLGIINGVDTGVFAPDANITRQDMCVMVVRAAEVSGKSINAVNEAVVFADDADIQVYAKEAVTKLQTAGIVNGVSDTTFEPNSNATRAQAAKILYSFL